ncbi:sugar phosphate isomerase/epimerase family protein [Winogradskyella sp. PE311]|uniref:sugar phosphate isomerase/epimerase family protein n=1 Tax=Winogradskyella sp. PE311 TaxID=3366943 RepID=UPI003980553E
MKRSEFLKASAALGTLSLLPYSCLHNSTSSKFKLGYQLYSIRDEMAKDPISTIKALKSMGYEDFEHYGFSAKNGNYYGFKVSEFKSRLDDLNLTVSSGHYPFANFIDKPIAELSKYADKTIKGALAMKSKYIVWPWIAPEDRNTDGYKKLSEKLNFLGEKITQAGLGFAYHNQGYEFDDSQGIMGYDIICKETDANLVKLQLDMYWIMHEAKTTPVAVIAKDPERFVMWHIKDMHKESRDYTELGNGSIDYVNLMPKPKDSGLEYFYIEQGGNFKENSINSAAFSAKYFKDNLQKYF